MPIAPEKNGSSAATQKPSAASTGTARKRPNQPEISSTRERASPGFKGETCESTRAAKESAKSSAMVSKTMPDRIRREEPAAFRFADRPITPPVAGRLSAATEKAYNGIA